MLSAVKLCQSSSMSGPSAQVKPISPKMAASSSITWPIGCSVPSVQVANSGRAGRLTSTFSLLSLAASAAAPSVDLARLERRLDLALELVDLRAELAALVGRQAAQRLHQSGDAALLAEGGHARGVERAQDRPPARRRRALRCVSSKDHSSLALRIPTRKKGACGPGSLFAILIRAPCGARTLLEGGLGLFDQGLKRCRLPHRQIGHDLAVDLDPGLEDAVHELRVGQAMLAGRGVDALDPQAAERALLVAPVAIGVLQALLDLLDADAERRAWRGRDSPWRASGPSCDERVQPRPA